MSTQKRRKEKKLLLQQDLQLQMSPIQQEPLDLSPSSRRPPLLLLARDGEVVPMPYDAALLSGVFQRMDYDCGAPKVGEHIPITTVRASILQKVVEWCTHHRNDPAPPKDGHFKKRQWRPDEIPPWDKQFLRLDDATLMELIHAAHFLEIRGLFEMAGKMRFRYGLKPNAPLKPATGVPLSHSAFGAAASQSTSPSKFFLSSSITASNNHPGHAIGMWEQVVKRPHPPDEMTNRKKQRISHS